MKKYRDDFLTALVKGLGTALAAGIVYVIGVGVNFIWAWFKGVHIAPETVSRLEFLGIAVFPCVLIVTVPFFFIRTWIKSSKIKNGSQQALSQHPAGNLSKTPRTSGEIFGIKIRAPSKLAFHVLTVFHQLDSSNTTITVQMVANLCAIDEDSARECMEELKDLGFIRIVSLGIGEWSGAYRITDSGKRYVFAYAT